MQRAQRAATRDIALGLKCNDCGDRYAWNRNIGRRKRCVCGCEWLEVWSERLTAEKIKEHAEHRPGWLKWALRQDPAWKLPKVGDVADRRVGLGLSAFGGRRR